MHGSVSRIEWAIRFRRRGRQLGLLLALLALVLRLPAPGLAEAAGGPNRNADLADLLDTGLVDAGLVGEVPICHAGADGTSRPEQPGHPAGSAHDCTLCGMCQGAAAPALLPGAAFVTAPSPLRRSTAALRPPSTGPPQPGRYAAPPRGPPVSSV